MKTAQKCTSLYIFERRVSREARNIAFTAHPCAEHKDTIEYTAFTVHRVRDYKPDMQVDFPKGRSF